jgi:hypothetical protein
MNSMTVDADHLMGKPHRVEEKSYQTKHIVSFIGLEITQT